MITVTVAVLTYNPDKEKLLATLGSVLLQKKVAFEVVIADDGSARKCFDDVRELFAEQGFSDYRIVENSENRGTVYNTKSAVAAARGKYVKLISPGDMLNGNDILHNWAETMEASGAVLSFADAVYYAPTENGLQAVVANANPSQVSCYEKADWEQGRYNYLICDDLFLGAATMCLREKLADYLEEIAGKVIYAEDNVYRLMAYDRVPVCYFRETAIIYETGLGVSTSGNSVWSKRLLDDWNACSQMLIKRCSGQDPIDKKLLCLLKRKPDNLIKKLLLHIRVPGLLFFKLRNKISRRKTENVLPQEFLRQVMPDRLEGENTDGH